MTFKKIYTALRQAIKGTPYEKELNKDLAIWYVERALRKVCDLYPEYYTATDDFTLTQDTEVYDVPSSYIGIDKIYYEGDEVIKVLCGTYNTIKKFHATTGAPEIFCYDKKRRQFKIYPTPDQDYTVQIRFYRLPEIPQNWNDTIDIPPEFETEFIPFTQIIMLIELGQYEKATALMAISRVEMEGASRLLKLIDLQTRKRSAK